MFHEQVAVALACVQMSVQLPPPFGRYCTVVLDTPEPASDPVPVTETMPVSGEPGSVVVAVAPVLSTRRENTAVDVPVLPRVSVPTTRKS